MILVLILHPDFCQSRIRIPDSGVLKALDPGSATPSAIQDYLES
jgi:hypothetical protein